MSGNQVFCIMLFAIACTTLILVGVIGNRDKNDSHKDDDINY